MFEEVLREFIASQSSNVTDWRYAVVVANDAESQAAIDRCRKEVAGGSWPSMPGDGVATRDMWVLVLVDSGLEPELRYWLEIHDPYALEEPVVLLGWRRAQNVRVPPTTSWTQLPYPTTD